jgi:spore coat-associated protein N
MKKIVGLSLALIMILGLMGVDTFAYFTDTETSSGNRLTAGTLDLKTNDVDGVSQTLYATSMSPGASVNATIALRNAGTTNGATLDIVFSYENSDGSPNTVPMDADPTAAVLQVTTLTYNGTDLLTSVSNGANGYKDILDLKNSDLTGLSGINAGATKNFVIAIRLRNEIGNGFQSDGIIMTMTFTLKQ